MLLIFVSCDSGSPEEENPTPPTPTPIPLEGITISDIAGDWDASIATFDIQGAGETQTVDIVELGGTTTLELASNGAFTLTIIAPAEEPDVFQGTMAIVDEQIEVTFSDSPGESQFFDFQATTITLDVQGTIEFDFDDDGTNEIADFEFDFNRV